MARRFRDVLRRPDASVLDVCCGTGDMTLALLKLRPVDSRPIIAADFSHQMLVRGDVFRGKFRRSFSKPEAFIPGKTEEVKYTMTDVAHTFKKGHCIMIQVQSSWFPITDRNPQQFVDIYHAKKSDFIKSDIRIYHSKDHPSRIILPVLDNK